MGSFNAAAAVEPLEYDFTAYMDGVQGVIPEPSQGQVSAYFREIAEAVDEVKGLREKVAAIQNENGEVDEENVDVAELMEEMKSFNMDETLGKITRATATLCSDQPSYEQIDGLPFRVRQAFIKWVGSQFRQG